MQVVDDASSSACWSTHVTNFKPSSTNAWDGGIIIETERKVGTIDNIDLAV